MEDHQQGDSGTTGLNYIHLASKTDTMKIAFCLILFFLEVWMVLGTAADWEPGKMETHPEVLKNHTFLRHNQTEGDIQHPQRKDATTSSEEEPWPALDRWKLLEKNANFGFNLFRKIAMKHDGNIVFSPFCLSFAMTTLLLAARGQTRSQILEGLNLQDLSISETTFLPSLFKELKDQISQNQELALLKGSFAFIHKDFDVKETFFNLSKQYFDMEYVPVNFHNATQAKSFMNHYVDKETKGKIPKLFDQINSEAELILVDYILFSGKWLSAFDPLLTEVETFHLDKYRTTKFKLDQKYEVQEILKQMGIRAIFSPWADLSELSGPARNLKVSKILQRTVIEVNERGTEAAAGTMSEIVAYSMPPVIKVDHPFHFMIYEETSKSLLFLGRVVNPSLL
ncbi:protein Z-dependent protease inhibitor isoform X3 [Phascolarctos cinereus]|uniref:Protein Z-dependent protease inhibitor isoform X4 n=1 Tax=Phascolarctos cinereus TaxID=38626 RepID=A0A6P5LD39_PHACI|nr:protein Z-dependent protease inhibitor isoform X4 [Phascolarctos cinereus]